MADVHNLVSEYLKAGYDMDAILKDLSQSDDKEENAFAAQWQQTAEQPQYQAGAMAPVTTSKIATKGLDFLNEHPEALAVPPAIYAVKKGADIYERRQENKMRQERHEFERTKAEAYARQVELQGQHATGIPNSLGMTAGDEQQLKALSPLEEERVRAAKAKADLAEAQLARFQAKNAPKAPVAPTATAEQPQPKVTPQERLAQGVASGLSAPQNALTTSVQGAAAPTSTAGQAQPQMVPAPAQSPVPSVTQAVATGQSPAQAIQLDVAQQLEKTSTTPEKTANVTQRVRRTNEQIAADKAALAAAAPEGFHPQYKASTASPIGPGAFNHLANNVGIDKAVEIWEGAYGKKNVPYKEFMSEYSKAAGKEMMGPVIPPAEGAKPGGSFGTPKFIPEYIKGSASPTALAATAALATIPALASAGYGAYKGNKEAINNGLKEAWDSLKSVVTMPYDVSKAAVNGDFGPFKDLLMSFNPATLMINEANKHDESAIKRMIQAEKVGAGRGIAPPSMYQR